MSGSLEESPIETIFDSVRWQLPSVEIEWRPSTDPLGNKNVWLIQLDGIEVWIISQPEGKPPFLIDREGKDWRVREPEKAVNLIKALLSTT
jgi:hypothetical protein